jgi:prepilin-type N-terminal cleavage/methylation domain-containing protein
MLVKKKNSNKPLGFTLIEIMVVIFIIGMMATATTMSFSAIFDEDIYQVARNITSNINYLYDSASLNNSYIKIEFDFKENSYKVSASRDRVLLFGNKVDVSSGDIEKSDKEKKRDERIAKENKEKEDALSSFTEDLVSDHSMRRFKQARFESIMTNDDMNFDIQLKPNVRINAVYTEYYEDYVTKKTAEVFIFPNNYMQRTVIVLEDIEAEKYLSILFEPFSGEATIVDGKYELSDEEEEIEEDE